MGANFVTDTSAINSNMKNIKQHLFESKTDLGLLVVDLGLLMTMWSGQASRAYFSTMIEDKNKIEEILDRYNKGIEKMSVSGFTYEKNERELVNKFKSINL